MTNNQTIGSKQEIKLSKYLSLVLRHKPEVIGIELDEQGWTPVSKLLEALNSNGKAINIHVLNRIIDSNDKKRFQLSEDQLSIRACQGHSVKVNLQLEEMEPPEFLYHGTATRFLPSILKEGLTPQARHQVHLSDNRVTAVNVENAMESP